MRPSKRPKPADSGRSIEDRSSTSRDDGLRRKVQDPASSSSRYASSSKDSRLKSSSSLSNGRDVLKAVTSSSYTGSPPPRSRGDSINGSRTAAGESNHSTPRKADSSKQFVPPLLSPLHFDIEGNKDDHANKKADRTHLAKPRNPDSQQSTKRPRSPVRPLALELPPLLSPTLPPEVEKELERRKKASPKSSENRERDAPEASGNAKRSKVEQPVEAPETSRKGMVVTLKIPKRLRREFRLLMKLSPRKESQRLERTSSASAPGVAQTIKAEKRPVVSGETSLEPTATKRPRPSDVSSASKGPIAPSTPSKKNATAMSRVSSSNSLAHTPGEAIAATPSAANERAPLSRATEAKIQILKDKETALLAIGRRVKHSGDGALGRRPDNASTNGSGRQGESTIKTGLVLSLECVAAFVTAFNIQDTHRGMANKPRDANSWRSLFPLIQVLHGDLRRHEFRRIEPIRALLLVLEAVAHDQVLNAWSTHEDPSNLISMKSFLKLTRQRNNTWSQVRDANEKVDSSMRVMPHPWTTVEEVVEMALRTLRRWCADEGLDWSAELNLRESGLKSVS